MEAVFFDSRQKQKMFSFFRPQSLVGPSGPLSTGVKQPRQESDRSSRPTVEVKNY
jgi:hypothetical protein